MSKLKAIFETLKFTDITTYINSGNIIFITDRKDELKLVQEIEKAVVVERVPVLCDPPVEDTEPDQFVLDGDADALQDVAFKTVHVRVLEFPVSIEEGEVDIVTVGAGMGTGLNATIKASHEPTEVIVPSAWYEPAVIAILSSRDQKEL